MESDLFKNMEHLCVEHSPYICRSTARRQIVNKLLQKASSIPDIVTPVLSSKLRCLWISW